MFPLSHMMKAFIKKGQLTVIDADGKRHVFSGSPGPHVTMRLTDKKLYRSLVFNSELAAGEAYMDGTMRFEEGSTLRDFPAAVFHQPAVARLLSNPEVDQGDQDALSQAAAIQS